jgi:hypothetical protein
MQKPASPREGITGVKPSHHHAPAFLVATTRTRQCSALLHLQLFSIASLWTRPLNLFFLGKSPWSVVARMILHSRALQAEPKEISLPQARSQPRKAHRAFPDATTDLCPRKRRRPPPQLVLIPHLDKRETMRLAEAAIFALPAPLTLNLEAFAAKFAASLDKHIVRLPICCIGYGACPGRERDFERPVARDSMIKKRESQVGV